MAQPVQEPLVPIGKVRHPDPVAPLERLVGETLTVGDIVSSPLWFIPPTLSVEDTIAAMEVHQFDVGGVGPEPLASFVELEQLKKVGKRRLGADVREYSKPIPASLCIERSLPISELFPLLKSQTRLFVLNRDQVRWLVTRADLAAPAVGAAMLGFFTIFEAGLKELSTDLSDERLKAILRGDAAQVPDDQVPPSTRLGKALRLYDDLRKKNLHTQFRDCLSLPDWLTVLKKEPRLLDLLGFSSDKDLKKKWGSFPDMRNDVAHVRGLLHTSSVEQAIEKIGAIQTAGRHVWTVVRHQAPIWDRYIETVVAIRGRSGPTLTGPDAATAFPFTSSVHVLSAWNPGSVWRSDSENRKANRILADTLRRHGKTPIAGTAHSPDGMWREDCFLVEHMSDQAAAALLTAFGQMSMFKITKKAFSIIDARSLDVVKTTTRVPVPTSAC